MPTPLVSTQWLAQQLGNSDVRIVDVSWYLPTAGRDPRAEYEDGHIPGAVFCDLDEISEPGSSLPHTLPSADHFSGAIGKLGITNQSLVVVYDASGVNLSAPRLWWMFRVFGHDSVAVLDGGMLKWRNEGRPVERGGGVRPSSTSFVARFRPDLVRDRASMDANLDHGREQVLDARSAGRFEGTEPEPRAGLASGHIPGSYNLPYSRLFGPDGTLLPPDQLRARFEAAGIDPSRPVVTTCGSGVTACALLLGLEVLGTKSIALYDGSWSEWGQL